MKNWPELPQKPSVREVLREDFRLTLYLARLWLFRTLGAPIIQFSDDASCYIAREYAFAEGRVKRLAAAYRKMARRSLDT